MPSKKPDPKPETDTSKAVVSRLGINDDPSPTEPKIVKTKNGGLLLEMEGYLFIMITIQFLIMTTNTSF